MNSLFGVELPTAVNFVIAFVFVLLLIGIAAWLVRRFGASRLDPTARGRQPRLAVIDSANVDGRRKLVIIRRDNIEHLLMIGGPTDVVVETNIVRAAAVLAREAPAQRNGGNETLLRAMPLPDPTPWPLQPEPAAAVSAARADRSPRISDETWHGPSETPIVQAPVVQPAPVAQAPLVRPVRAADTLAGLAEELARPAQPEAPRISAQQPATGSAAAAPAPQPTDQSLAEMAQRLEAALRRPAAQKIVSESNRVTTIVEVKATGKVAAQPKAAAQPKPQPQPQPQPQAQPQQHSLEQEMASLLSRPGKT
jgi:flagellar biogenesis protein FliO